MNSLPSLLPSGRTLHLRTLLMAGALYSLSLGSHAQVSPPRPAPLPAAPAPGVPADTLTAAATNVGVKRCLPAISRLSSLTLNGSTGNDVLVDWDRKNPDGGPFFSL